MRTINAIDTCSIEELKELLVEILNRYLNERDPGSISNRIYMRLSFFNDEITNAKRREIESLKNYAENRFNAIPCFILLYNTYHKKFTTQDGKKIRYGSDGECGIALRICMGKILLYCDPELTNLKNHIKTFRATNNYDSNIIDFATNLLSDLKKQTNCSFC